MKRLAVFLLVLFAPLLLDAQTFRAGFVSNHQSVNLAAGFFPAESGAMRDHLSEAYNHKFFEQPLYAGGLMIRAGVVSGGSGNYDGHLHLLFLVPQEEKVNDSLRFRLGGWQYGMGLFGKDALWFTDVADLIIAPGMSFGNFKLRRWDDERASRYTNPFFAPKITGELRICLGPFSLGARGEYLYDVTNPIWKRKTGFMPVIPGTYVRGPLLLGFIGWTGAQNR